jgi:hypothetical protein
MSPSETGWPSISTSFWSHGPALLLADAGATSRMLEIG